MQLSYKASRADVAFFYWRSLRRNPRHRRSWLAMVLAGAGVGALAATTASASPATVMSVASVGALATAALLALAPLLLFKPRVRTLVLVPGGIQTAIGDKKKSYTWTEISSVDEVEDRIVIQCANLNAFIIPPGAFESAAERREAYAVIQQYFRAARTASGGAG